MGGEDKQGLIANEEQGYPQQGYPQQPYPAQPYPAQPYPAQPYPQQGYPQQGGYPQGGYPPPGQPGYEQFPPGAAVVVNTNPEMGLPPIEEHELPMAEEAFMEQVTRLPGRMLQAVKPQTILDNLKDLKRFASWPMVLSIMIVQLVWGIIIEAINYQLLSDEQQKAVSLGANIGVGIAFAFAYFFIQNGLMHLCAGCLSTSHDRHVVQGQPTFLQLCFLVLLWRFPLDILSILTIIPYLGFVLSLVILVYGLVLLVFTLRAVYHVTSGQAIGIIVIFVIFIIVVAITLAVVMSAALATVVFRASS